MVASALCSAFVFHTASAAELLDRAVLPANTFSTGPTSGQFATGGNGIVLPLINKQPVQGFSAVLPGPVKGTYLVMADNGFGAKANSPDALLRVYTVKPDFETGTVTPVNRFTGDELQRFHRRQLHHAARSVEPACRSPSSPTARSIRARRSGGGAPSRSIPSITAGRLLTGADFDIESIRRAPDGTLWFGDEFGPYLLHTDVSGRVLEAPIPLPNFRGVPEHARRHRSESADAGGQQSGSARSRRTCRTPAASRAWR